MDPEIIVALIAFGGSAIGTLTGITINSKLTNYRLEQLESEVRMHNNFARRMPVVEEQIKVINHRISDLESQEKEK